MNRMSVEAGGVTVAGSAVAHDGLQLASARLLGVSSGERYMHWRYDVRSRVIASLAGVPASANPIAPVPGRTEEAVSVADFRTAQPRTSRFDEATAATLQAKGVDTAAIDPPTATFQEQPGHKIAEAVKGPQVRPFGWNGAERVDDGRFVYEFDAKGRLLRATEKGSVPPLRRLVYSYSGTGRVVGRRAEYTTVASPAPIDWRLEDRNQFIDADGLPADTTFVWDPISDNLLAVFKAAPTAADANGGLLKQIIHGGMAYDDPIETTSANVAGGVMHLYPVFDEAGAGSLQIVLNDAGAVVARTLPNDPYGGQNVDFSGAAIDRIAVEFHKDASDVLVRVEVTIHATEQLDAASLEAGVRLATVDADGNPVHTSSALAALDATDPFTARWTLTPTQWTALTDPSPATVDGTTLTPVALSVAATTALRAASWALETPIMPAPEWAVATLSVFNDRHPVELREPLTSLSTPTSRTLYAVEDLSLLGLSGSDTLIENIAAARFQALPFAEPATGLVYARARWYDPSTGSFLSPDPKGYIDSSNLYAFAGGDPVNRRDPTGEFFDAAAAKVAAFAKTPAGGTGAMAAAWLTLWIQAGIKGHETVEAYIALRGSRDEEYATEARLRDTQLWVETYKRRRDQARAASIPQLPQLPDVSPHSQQAQMLPDGSAQRQQAVAYHNQSVRSRQPVSGETPTTRIGREVHAREETWRSESGGFDLVNGPITNRDGTPILVPHRVDLRTGLPQEGTALQEAVPDAVSYKRRLIVDDKPLGRPLAKDRQELIRFIRAYELREGQLPTTIAIQRYDPVTGKVVRTDIHRPEEFLPKP